MDMNKKKILITGGTGFIGNYLTTELLKEGHYITIVSRSPEKYTEKQAENRNFVGWDGDLLNALNEADVIINLAGKNLFGRWTESIKREIYDSRIENTRKLVNAIERTDSKPELLISASGVSIYGDHKDQVIDEKTPSADTFLGKVCRDWESEASRAGEFDVRVAITRFGPVLEGDGGLIEKMRFPFLMFVGGPVGSGNQYIPWIHMKDLCNAIRFPMQNEKINGPYNVCSPEPETMDNFAKKMGEVMNRPSIFRVPEFVLKMVLGEGAQPAIESLRVQPKVLQKEGFNFEFEDLTEALADIL